MPVRLSRVVPHPAKFIAENIKEFKLANIFSKQYLKLAVLIAFTVGALFFVAKPAASKVFDLFGFDRVIENISDHRTQVLIFLSIWHGRRALSESCRHMFRDSR